MTYSAIILSAAKKIGLSGHLLLAICTQESNLTNAMVLRDGNSPSYGVCQIKLGTANMMGHQGPAKDLMNPYINAKFAAKYLHFQLKRYNFDQSKAIAAYNAGSFNESKKYPGKPRNLKYLKRVQMHLHNIQRKHEK